MKHEIPVNDMLYGLAILLAFLFFGSGLVVGLVGIIAGFVRNFSLALVGQVFYALIIWVGAVALAVTLFVFVGRFIRHLRR